MENKVLNFLEWLLKEKSPAWIPVGEYGEDFALADLVDKVANFYSQSFKPSDITELFEGVVNAEQTLGGKSGFKNDCLVYKVLHLPNPCEYLVFVDYVDSFLQAYKKNPPAPIPIFSIYHNQRKRIWRTSKPQTLDNFITDCQRAGISLNWKPEILNKYFK